MRFIESYAAVRGALQSVPVTTADRNATLAEFYKRTDIHNTLEYGATPKVGYMTIILETDQKFCFDEAGNRIDCRDTLQDAAYKRSRSYSSTRFCVCNDSIEDRWTGLLWHKNANMAEFPLNWEEALDFIEEMNHSATSGINNWRLPTRSDLFSLVSHQYINPALPEHHPFENVFNGYYWTQTECSRLSDQAWYIHLGGGRVYRGMKHGSYMVWPVASDKIEKQFADDRFHTDGITIYDSLTNRTWLVGKEQSQVTVTWKEAIEYIKGLNNRNGGFGDWRLPNIRELESLVDTTQHSPAFAAPSAFDKIQEGYWSSTTSLYEPRYAWVLYTRDGAVGVGFKPHADFSILPVRG